MAFFKRKNKKYDLSDVLDDNDFIMDFGETPINRGNDAKIKPAHALTARELLNGNAPAEDIPMQSSTSAAEALRSRMQKPLDLSETAEKIPMQAESTPSSAVSEDFEQLISRLHTLVKDIGTVKEDTSDMQTLSTNDIDDIISLAERRAKQRADAAYSRHIIPPEEEYPFYNPLAADTDTAAAVPSPAAEEPIKTYTPIAKTEPEDITEPVAEPPQKSAPKAAADSPLREKIAAFTTPEPEANVQMHLAAEEITVPEETIPLHATIPFDISEEVTAAQETEPYGTQVYSTVQLPQTKAGDILPPEDETEDEPEQEDFSNDYTCIDDAPQAKLRLAHSIKKLGLRTAVSAVCSLLLLLFSGALFVQIQLPLFTLNLLQLGILLVCAAAGFNILRGILSIFKGVSDVDSIAAAALLCTLAHNIYFGFILKQAPVIRPEAAIAVSLTLFNYAKLLNVRRIYQNFCRIATSNEKRALHFIKKEAAVNAIVRGALDGPALICTGRRTVNVNGFFKYTYSRDLQSAVSGRLLVIAAVVSVLIGVLSFIKVGGDFAFTAAALTLSLFAAPATILVSVLPLKAAADTLTEYDSVLPGYASAMQIRNANAVAVDIADLFPKGCVRLFNMHTLSKNPVDRSLCEAAAVVMAAKSPLSDIFAQITGSLKENLPAVDSMLYEERLGLSGWVDDRRILIGNRTLMENHNVRIPSYEVDKKILAKGFFPVYIAADSKPCVLLVVGYTADDTITYELRRLCNAGYTVMVNSCDPNTSSEMLSDYFGLPEGAIKTMNADGARAYKEETNYQESMESVAAYNSSVCGLFALATASMRVPALSLFMMVLNLIAIAVGVSALGCFIFMGTTALLSPLLILVYQLISTLVIGLMPMLFKP